MAIWVDADAAPKRIKEILYKAATKRKLTVTFVANQYLTLPKSPFLKMLRVEKGFDVADNKIVELVQKNDLVITADVPLAAEIVAKGAIALNPRGELITTDNAKQRLSIRDTMESMRETGVQVSGPPPLHEREIQKFANALDSYITKNC